VCVCVCVCVYIYIYIYSVLVFGYKLFQFYSNSFRVCLIVISMDAMFVI
jgi:hypothetical protein